MLEMQHAMNSKINPGWKQAGSEWYRAIWVECAELLDHYGWKWWKYQQPDMDQVKLEIVDIWHFVMSDLLQDGLSDDALARQIQSQLGVAVTADGIADAIEKLALKALQTRRADVSAFAVVMQQVNLSFDELFKAYVGKNVLNVFRQDHGYKDGTYMKIWGEHEDNVHLNAIMASLDVNQSNLVDYVYHRLAAAYPG